MSQKLEFEKKFIDEIVVKNGKMSEELNELFNDVLANDFGDNAEMMDEYITSLHNLKINRLDGSTSKSNVELAIIKLTEKLSEEDAKEVLDLLDGIQ